MNILFAAIILLVYTLVLCKRIGDVPPSLSASVFAMPQSRRWIWTVVLYAVCFLCLMPWPWSYLDKVSENTQFLAFIAIAALAFVGAAPLVKDNQTLAYKVHCTAAIVCAVCSQLVLVFNNAWLLLLWLPWIYWFVWKTRSSVWETQTFWAEMVCFASTLIFCAT